MAEAAAKLPVKNEKGQMPSRSPEWAPFESLRHEIDRLFDDFHPFGWDFPSTRSLLGFQMPRAARENWQVMAPAVDVSEKDGEYEVTAELPSLDEKDVEVIVEEGVLTLRGEKKSEVEDKDRGYSERSYGRFERRIGLPKGIEQDKASATFKNGVLTVTVPKSASAAENVRRIAVNSGQA